MRAQSTCAPAAAAAAPSMRLKREPRVGPRRSRRKYFCAWLAICVGFLRHQGLGF